MTREEKDAEIERLTAHVDLMMDEFKRIRALEFNSEVSALCERAITQATQKVPVIAQRDKAEREVERLKGELAEALDVISGCARQFREYERIHSAKLTIEGWLKAEANSHWARTLESFLQKHTPPLNCGSAAAGESPSHSGGGVKCEPDCRMCSGEYCKIHLNKPCDCDCLDRHGIFQNHQQQKPGGAS